LSLWDKITIMKEFNNEGWQEHMAGKLRIRSFGRPPNKKPGSGNACARG